MQKRAYSVLLFDHDFHLIVEVVADIVDFNSVSESDGGICALAPYFNWGGLAPTPRAASRCDGNVHK